MTPSTLQQILAQLAGGETSLVDALRAIRAMQPESAVATFDAHVDVDRARRCGYPEVVYAEGKSAASIVQIFATIHARGEACLATRLSDAQAEAVLNRFPQAVHNPTARTIRVAGNRAERPRGRVVVLTAGTSDRPVAEEAVETLLWMNCEAELIVDVGVAGPHRLSANLNRLQEASAVVVAAGMEGALPSVVGGHVACPVVAVPTSVGYGASFGGVAALLGMLNSCAANVTVVNIDAGFKAGYLAGLIARQSTS